MFKAITTTTLTLFLCANLFGQMSTIQVTVSDTIMVPADHITIAVTFKDTATIPPYMYEVEGDREASEAENATATDAPPIVVGPDFAGSFEQVKAILKKNNISWKKTADQMGGLMGGLMGGMAALGKQDTAASARNITFDFKSKAQMDEVLPKIKAITFAETLEMGMSVDKESVNRKGLYEKLFKKSRVKAGEIASLAGKRIGDIHQIGNAFDGLSPEKQMESMMGDGGMFGGLFKMMGNMFSEKNTDYKVKVSESMTVTFLMY